jgi:translation initiation factor 2B subunit (eIF-2B alpha/beta/delta family)
MLFRAGEQASVEVLIRDYAADRIHGAAYLANAAGRILVQAAAHSTKADARGRVDELRTIARRLVRSKPSMASVANASAALVAYAARRTGNGASTAQLADGLAGVAQRLESERETALRAVVDSAVRTLHAADRLLTHSFSATVRQALRRLRPKHVFVTESRPLLEGEGLASELARAGIETTLLVDAAAAQCIPQVDAVVVGADTVTQDGAVINKTGTRGLAAAARVERVPFYVACDSWKFAPWSSTAVSLEEGPRSQLTRSRSQLLHVRNPYFDVTPPALLSRVVCEYGALRPAQVRHYAARFARFHRQAQIR